VLDGSVYEKAKSIWQRNIKNKSKNAAVLANAAQFFIPTDEALAERILVKAAAANPKSPAGFRRLGELYLGQMDEVLGESRPKYAAKALAQFEQALKLIPQGVGRFRLLPDAARAALESGNTKKASTYSNQLLLLSAKYGTDPNFGDAVHKANLVRGRAALRNGDITKAKSCLIAAGNTPGSPTIQSTGPGMALAGELLKKGEKDIVLEYLGLCEDLWEVGRADILAWKKAISEGQTPDFGANQLF
jgi:tetratricopeptide (TPR) repeat protein